MKPVPFLSHLERYRKQKKCGVLVLIDPDKAKPEELKRRILPGVMAYLVGGSVITSGRIEKTIRALRQLTNRPIFLFPGHSIQTAEGADGILLPSLISGRNPDYLIGQHVHAAFAIERSGMEVIPAGYILCGGARVSGTQYITQTLPVPSDKPELVMATALAGIQLGMKVIYLEAGSGQDAPPDKKLVKEVAQRIQVPLIAGGGIRTASGISQLKNAGASAVVIGNILETHPGLLRDFLKAADD
ncbi:MAG: geranylgeranylglyceryl/heptaprenylglyceryl phosphate synthase [Bacteroidia bacterium]|nr:geranylgeranylglyceryl/heptaprenylglyceryl phosphate synthase [Bacteroidia bacterium]